MPEKLQARLALFRERDLWEDLMEVLQEELHFHLRAAALGSGDERSKIEHAGVARWLDEVLCGGLDAYRVQAEVQLGRRKNGEIEEYLDGRPGGDPYMPPDSGEAG